MDENVDLQQLLDDNNVEGMRAYLEGGGDVQGYVPYEVSPDVEVDITFFHYAVLMGGSAEMIDLLLEKGADPTVFDGLGSPFSDAVSKGQIENVRKFVAKMGAVRTTEVLNNNEEYYEPPFMGSIRTSNKEFVQFLLDEGGDPNVTDSAGENSAMSLAVKMVASDPNLPATTEIVTLLLERGGDKDVALITAAKHGLADIVRLTLDRGANVNAQDSYDIPALSHAIMNDHLEIARLLLDRGADINVKDGDGDSAILYASQFGDLPEITLLLEKGAKVDDTTISGYTPLICVAERGKLDAVRLLLDRGANVNHQAEEPSLTTALNTASFGGHLDVVRLLLDRGADIEHREEEGWTPLRLAVQNGHIEVARLLLERGANVNTADDSGVTVLMRAAFDNKIDLVKLLLEKGADTTLRSQNGQSALDRAKTPEMRALLSRKWEGLTAEEKTLLDNLLLNPTEGSFCPVCLIYVKNGEDLYAEHDCKTTPGSHLHPELWRTYHNTDGKTRWCTQCGRISKKQGEFVFHYPLVPYQTERVPKIINYDSSMAYRSLEDNCKGHGGGGIAEKVARSKQRVEWSLYLQTKQLGKISEEDAYKEIVEESWNAPLRRQPRPVAVPQPPPAGAASGSATEGGRRQTSLERRRTYRRRHRHRLDSSFKTRR